MHARTRKLVALLALTCGGCGADGLSPHEQNGQDLAAVVYQQPDLTADQTAGMGTNLTVAKPPSITLPIRVGVVQMGEVAPPQAMLDAFRTRPDLFKTVEPLPGNLNEQTPHMPKLRSTAAGLGFDYLLVYGGTVDRGRTPTPMEVFNLTIIGLFVVPSDQIWANGKAAGSLIDVSTGRIAMNLSVETRGSAFLPSVMADGAGDALVNGVREDLIRKMTDQTIARLDDGLPKQASVKASGR